MKKFLEKIKNDRISEYSAQSAYFIILSIIPFVLVFISLVQYISIDKDTLIYYAKQIIPNTFQEFSLNIIEEIYSKTITTLSISIFFTIWSASKGCFAIMKGINDIYNVEIKGYLYSKIRAFIFTILFMFLLILMLLVIVLGNNILNSIGDILVSDRIAWILDKMFKFKDIWVSIIIFLTFLFFYKYIPNCKLKFKNQIFGAFIVTIFWYILSYAFSLYVKIYNGFSMLYGSLTTIILFMIWAYALIYIILVGAEINSYFKE